MMSKEKIDYLKKEIQGIFNKFLGDDYLLIAFGSLARGKYDKSSDIDLAVYRKKTISTKLILEIREELERNVHTLKDIDLINLTEKEIGLDLLKNILEEGTQWQKAKNSEELLGNLKKRLVNIKK